MSNITLKVDDEIIRKVRKIAIDKDSTLTQMVREFLCTVAEGDRAVRTLAVYQLMKSFEELGRDMGRRDWSRGELYER